MYDFLSKENNELAEKYPFLLIRNGWDEEICTEVDSTWFDDIPEGWRKAFGIQMCDELKEALEEEGYLDK